MNRDNGTSIRHRLQALGASIVIAGTILATAATSALAMPARQANATSIRQEIYNSLKDLTWAASKVAAEPDVYVGLADRTAPGTFRAPHQVPSLDDGSTFSAPHQVAPLR